MLCTQDLPFLYREICPYRVHVKFRTSENKCLKCFYVFMPVVELTECGTDVKGCGTCT